MSMGEEKRILLATDFSAPAERAYAYAARLAKALNATVVILHVLEGPPGLDREFPVNTLFLKQLQEESDREMAKLVLVAEKDGLTCKPWQVYGTPAACISNVAKEAATALIVMGGLTDTPVGAACCSAATRRRWCGRRPVRSSQCG